MPSTQGLRPGDKIPDFQLPDLNGSLHTQKSFAGKPLLLFFLRGTW